MTPDHDDTIDPDTLAALEQTAIDALHSDDPASAPPKAPRRFDFTALSTAQECPRRYILEHVLGLPHEIGAPTDSKPDETSNATSAADDLPEPIRVGTLFHTVVERYWPTDQPPSAWKDHAAKLAAARSWDDCENRVEELIDAFFESPVAEWSIQSNHLEVRFEFEIEGRPITGTIDAIPIRPDGQAVILDHKTGRSDPVEEQLLLYLLAAHRDEDIDLPTLPTAAVFLKADGNTFEIEPLEIRDLDATLQKAARMAWKWIQQADTASYDDPLPGIHCSRCPYQRVCDVSK